MTQLSTWCGHLRLVGENFSGDTTTTLDVRRVKRGSQEEHVQISVMIEKQNQKRTTTSLGYVQLSPEDVPFLITALSKLRPSYDAEERLQKYPTFEEEDAADRAFYGLT